MNYIFIGEYKLSLNLLKYYYKNSSLEEILYTLKTAYNHSCMLNRPFKETFKRFIIK